MDERSVLTFVLATLAVVAVLVALRLFLLRPRERPPDFRSAFADDARSALRALVDDPDGAEGRRAEASSDWPAAAAAYARALARVRDEDPDTPARALKIRALESKLEEIARRPTVP
jgi:hypothetical protein